MADPRKPLNPEDSLPPGVAAKLAAVRKAASHNESPGVDIEQMLAEIELGYLSQFKIEDE